MSKLIKSADLDRYESWVIPDMRDIEDTHIVSSHDVEELLESPSAAVTAQALEKIQKDAWQEGFDQGRSEGLQQGLASGKQLVEGISALLAPQAEIVGDEVRQQLVDLAVKIAREVIGREITLAPDQLSTVVDEAIACLPEKSGKLVVYVCPDDLDYARSDLAVDGFSRVVFLPDSALGRGDCRLETELSEVENTAQQRLASVIEHTIANMYEEVRDEHEPG
ncbi:MAG: FliH/SctL family protein [Gammaproteobacteria bacterium]|nr:FliH/SctL family protein [Gammaproteobacteria bacterium]